jgi:YD repeat-containing protein
LEDYTLTRSRTGFVLRQTWNAARQPVAERRQTLNVVRDDREPIRQNERFDDSALVHWCAARQRVAQLGDLFLTRWREQVNHDDPIRRRVLRVVRAQAVDGRHAFLQLVSVV